MDSMVAVALAIVLVSGLIAYIGDWVGRKMGRKRLTLFGLRPRHTAVVVSVGAGMLISTLTLSLSFAVSGVVREAFFTPIKKLKRELQEAKATKATTQAELDAVKAKSSSAASNLTNAQYQLQLADARIAKAQLSLRGVEQALTQKNAELAKVSANLNRVRGEFARVREELATSEDRLGKNAQKLGDLNTQLHGLQWEYAALVAQRDDLDQQVKELRLVVSEFARVSFARLAFTAGQELLTGLMPAGDTAARRGWMTGFLDTAEVVARQQCPKLVRDAAAITYLNGAGGGLRRLTRDEATTMLLARAGRTGAGPLIVRMAPANNTPEEGPALVLVDGVEMQPDGPAFARGTILGKIEVAGGAGADHGEVLRAVMDDLLRGELPQGLRSSGMVSATRRYDPRHPGVAPDPATPQVSWSEIMAAVDRAAAQPGRTQVRVIAAGAATRFGPPTLTLDVAPAP